MNTEIVIRIPRYGTFLKPTKPSDAVEDWEDLQCDMIIGKHYIYSGNSGENGLIVYETLTQTFDQSKTLRIPFNGKADIFCCDRKTVEISSILQWFLSHFDRRESVTCQE